MSRFIALAGGALVAAISSTSPAAAAPAQIAIRAGIQAVLDASARAWSAGELDRFMTCYEQSPDTSYVSGSRLVRGYDAIRAMYAERFGGGDRAAMGQLAIEILEVRPLGRDHAYVIGRFHLHREPAAGGDASGPTTLVFHLTPDGWRIVADHS